MSGGCGAAEAVLFRSALQQLRHAVDGIDVFRDHLVDDLFHGPDVLHLSYDLSHGGAEKFR